MNITTEQIRKVFAKKAYKWDSFFNIVWIRSNDKTPNIFNDYATVHILRNDKWFFHCYTGTTDPGLYWLKNPENIKGTAILKPGQYINCWKRGLHKGDYALIQCAPVTVYRDNNRDNKFDLGTKIDTGIFGINSHRANHDIESRQVDKWSAGCMVIASPKNHETYMMLCDEADRPFYTITLLEENDL